MREYIISLSKAGRRLDQVVAELIPEYSRNQIQHWISSGNILVDGSRAKTKFRLHGGEKITLQNPVIEANSEFCAEIIEFKILFEDEQIAVINKPAGLVVHPAAGNWSGTLLNGLLNAFPENKNLPRAGIVHRLDKDTSGLLIIAKTLESQISLVRQLQARTVKREYSAIVYGTVIAANEINQPIGRSQKNRKLMSITKTGKPAVTHVIPEELGSGWSLIRCQLETGRTHQIRVHLKSINHPIIGDQSYLATKYQKGRIGTVNTINRQALHAKKLEIIHPLLDKPMQWEIEPPKDFQDTLKYLREKH